MTRHIVQIFTPRTTITELTPFGTHSTPPSGGQDLPISHLPSGHRLRKFRNPIGFVPSKFLTIRVISVRQL